jgi:hypothetical protein
MKWGHCKKALKKWLETVTDFMDNGGGSDDDDG